MEFENITLQVKKNIPIITNYDFDNVIVRGILSYVEEVVPGVEPFPVRLDNMANMFISGNSVAVLLLPDCLDYSYDEILKGIDGQAKKYNLTVLAIAADGDTCILKNNIVDSRMIICGNKTDFAQSKQTAGLYLSRYGFRDKKTILLVDDSGEVLRAVKSWLNDKYTVVMAKSGEMAFRYMSKKIPDLILLDYEMPGMNGKEVFQGLKKNIITEDIPVFFLTGKNDRNIVLDIMSVHPEGYILKTEDKEKVLSRINDFFKRQSNKK